MLFKALSELPEKIQNVISSVSNSGKFICAVKTAFKPNATIPILWIVVTENMLLLCNTHRTRGLFYSCKWHEINCVRRRDNQDRTLEIIHKSLDVDDCVIPLPEKMNTEEIDALIMKCETLVV